MRTARSLSLLLMLILFGPGANAAPTERELRAAFLYNFAKFIEWPVTPMRTFRICTTEDELFETIRSLTGREISGQPIDVAVVSEGDDGAFKSCRILYLDRELSPQSSEPVAQAERDGMLVVGKVEPLGAINFIQNGSRLGFVVNQKRIRRAGLKMSAKLLQLAVRVE